MQGSRAEKSRAAEANTTPARAKCRAAVSAVRLAAAADQRGGPACSFATSSELEVARPPFCNCEAGVTG